MKSIYNLINKDNLDGEYKVTILFNKEISNKRMPDNLIIGGSKKAQILIKSIDNKLVYTGSIKDPRLKDMYVQSLESESPSSKRKVSVGCSVSITSPGEFDSNCGETCPKKTSILGDDTWFCTCVYDCHFEVSF